MEISIIGAGIAGLTTALFLERQGYTVNIYERATKLEAVGAGITLAHNAMQVFENLGIAHQLKKEGHLIEQFTIATEKLDTIQSIQTQRYDELFQTSTVAIARARLQNTLLNSLEKTSIHLGYQLQKLHQNSEQVHLRFNNGFEVSTSMVIAADGIRSITRSLIAPNATIRTTSQYCWRGIANFDIPSNYVHKLHECWGGTYRFGFVPIDKNQVYWFAVTSEAQRVQNTLHPTSLLTAYANFHPLVTELITHTPKSKIHGAAITDLPQGTPWYQGRVCCIGDAAHATTPNMGQGACQAIEDAYLLSTLISEQPHASVFNTFQKLRTDKVRRVIQQSYRIGTVAHWKSPVLKHLRNKGLEWMPKRLQENNSIALFSLVKAPKNNTKH